MEENAGGTTAELRIRSADVSPRGEFAGRAELSAEAATGSVAPPIQTKASVPAPPRSWTWAFLVAAVIAAASANILSFAALNPFDDAFIAYRYARNLAEGAGPVFNPGEYVEGFSSALWVGLLALGGTMGMDEIGLSKGLSIVGAAACVALAWALARFAGAGRNGALAAALLIALLPGLALHASSGLETTVYAALVSALFLLVASAPAARWTAALVGLLAALTRPEGILVGGLALGWLALRATPVRSIRSVRSMVRAWTPFCVFLAAYGLFLGGRLALFGDLLPNTYYAKAEGLEWRVTTGVADLVKAGRETWFALALLPTAYVMWPARERRQDRRVDLRASLCICALGVAALIWEGGDCFEGQRFLLPYLPLLAAAAVLGLTNATRRLRSQTRRLLLVGVIALMAVPPVVAWPKMRADADLGSNLIELWKLAGVRLAAEVPGERSVALSPVGALPFMSRLRTIDLLGLTDAHIARRPSDPRIPVRAHRKHDGAYVLARDPDLVMLGNGLTGREPFRAFPPERVFPYERDLFDAPEFAERYVLKSLRLDDRHFLAVHVRRDLPEASRWP